jgi:hypothetical protein
MSDLDILIAVSRSRLVRLEEHLQFEKEKLAKMEKEKFEPSTGFGGDEARMGCIQSPLKAIQAIVDQKKVHMTHPSPSFGTLDARYYHKDTLSALEPILKMLKKIEERLDALEHK